MSKVSVNANPNLPSERIINKVGKPQLKDHVIDEQDRVIKLKTPDALDEFDLNSALGQDSVNPGVASMAQALLYVVSIDGEPFIQAKSYAQVRAAIQKLGRHGIQAIIGAANELAIEVGMLSEKEQQAEIKK